MSRTDRRADIPWDEIREHVEAAEREHAETIVIRVHKAPRGRAGRKTTFTVAAEETLNRRPISS